MPGVAWPHAGFSHFWGNIRPLYSFIAQLPIFTSAGWWRLGGELPVFVPFAPAEATDEARILQEPQSSLDNSLGQPGGPGDVPVGVRPASPADGLQDLQGLLVVGGRDHASPRLGRPRVGVRLPRPRDRFDQLFEGKPREPRITLHHPPRTSGWPLISTSAINANPSRSDLSIGQRTSVVVVRTLAVHQRNFDLLETVHRAHASGPPPGDHYLAVRPVPVRARDPLLGHSGDHPGRPVHLVPPPGVSTPRR